jgi:chromosome segregation ATPase
VYGPAEAGNAGEVSALLAPLRLPERALRALESLAGAAQHLGPMRSEIVRVRELIESVDKKTDQVPEMLSTVQRISRQAEPLEKMLPAIDHLEKSTADQLAGMRETLVALESDESHLNKAVEDLKQQISDLHGTIRELHDDVQRVTDRLPDPNRGPLEKAKDVLTGDGT